MVDKDIISSAFSRFTLFSRQIVTVVTDMFSILDGGIQYGTRIVSIRSKEMCLIASRSISISKGR